MDKILNLYMSVVLIKKLIKIEIYFNFKPIRFFH